LVGRDLSRAAGASGRLFLRVNHSVPGGNTGKFSAGILVAGLLLAAVDRALSAPLGVGCRRWCRRQAGALRRAARRREGVSRARRGSHLRGRFQPET
ncbi:MAG TPA: hypothetical protein VL382_07890, partial [Terriglobales bacterium]|nr:hypothetical protein [Terriglobales bacterium]